MNQVDYKKAGQDAFLGKHQDSEPRLKHLMGEHLKARKAREKARKQGKTLPDTDAARRSWKMSEGALTHFLMPVDACRAARAASAKVLDAAQRAFVEGGGKESDFRPQSITAGDTECIIEGVNTETYSEKYLPNRPRTPENERSTISVDATIRIPFGDLEPNVQEEINKRLVDEGCTPYRVGSYDAEIRNPDNPEGPKIKRRRIDRINLPLKLVLESPRVVETSVTRDPETGQQQTRVTLGDAQNRVSDDDARAWAANNDKVPCRAKSIRDQYGKGDVKTTPTLHEVISDTSGAYSQEAKTAAMRDAKGHVVADKGGLMPGSALAVRHMFRHDLLSHATAEPTYVEERQGKTKGDLNREPRGQVQVNRDGRIPNTMSVSAQTPQVQFAHARLVARVRPRVRTGPGQGD